MKILIALTALTLVFSGYKAKSEIVVKDENIGTTFDFITLNELNERAESFAQFSTDQKSQFNKDVETFLGSGIQDMSSFISLVDGNDKYNQAYTGRRILTGQLNPNLLKSLFSQAVGQIITSREILNTNFNYAKKLDKYQHELYLAGLVITGHSIANHNFKGLSEKSILHHIRLGKKAIFIHSLLNALDIRTCSSQMDSGDFLSAVWFLESYINRLLPNRFAGVFVTSDECSKKLYDDLGFKYVDFVEAHARKIYLP